MKKLLAVFLALIMLLSFATAEEAAEPALTKNLVILYTSDVHCGIEQGWGYAGLYAVKEYYAADNYVMLVDDGDAIQGEPIGTMTKGEGIIDIMNAVGYDLAIPGNHEFDYGMDNFLALTEKGVFCSSSAGRSWLTKNASSIARSLVALQDGGKEVIGMTADGHIYASSSEGATWLRRK